MMGFDFALLIVAVLLVIKFLRKNKNPNKKLIWLDDIRNPYKNDWLVFSPIEHPFETIWVKSYDEFTDWITKNGLPDGICYDHDLGDNRKEEIKSGMDCAKWLVEYCLDNNLKLPPYNIQSANPAGKENIDGLFKSFIKQTQ